MNDDKKELSAIVAEITKMRGEEVANLRSMFNFYIQKVQILYRMHKLNKETSDEVVKDMFDFLINISDSYIGQWCMVEKSLNIIQHLEAEITNLGGDIEKIRETYTNK